MVRLQVVVLVMAAWLGAAGCVGDVGDVDEDFAQNADDMSSVRPLFDLGTLRCADVQSSCPVPAPEDEKGVPKCFCLDDFERQNYVVEQGGNVRGHYLAVGSDLLRDAILSVGNRPAFYVDVMNDDWETLGAAGKAQALWTSASNKFHGQAPTWFVLNEISKSRWKSNQAYREYVVNLARRLNQTHGRKVLVLSPFSAPGMTQEGFAPSWSRLGKYAYVGVENYLSGGEIAKGGYSEAWCRTQYQKSITWYENMGVPRSRLVLVEHFGHTSAGYEWGRGGLAYPDWLKAIRIRSRAARSLPFFGYASYGWSSNQMNALNDRRQAAQDAYHQAIEGAPITVFPIEPPGSAPDMDPPTEPDPEPEDVPPAPSPGGDVLAPNTMLAPGASVTSSDGRFTFVYQTDGNLVLYQGSTYLWASNTQNTPPGVTIMQGDGNLVIYDGNGEPRWASGTYNQPGAQLIVQTDGNVVIYGPDAAPVWATNTCCH